MAGNLKDLERFFDQMIRTTITAASVANNKMANELMIVYKSFASGEYSLDQLAAMGHPYAKRNAFTMVTKRLKSGVYRTFEPKAYSGYPYGNPGILNVQTGLLRQSFVKDQVQSKNGIREYIVWNADPKASVVEEGDENTIARPIRKLAIDYVNSRHADILEEEITRRLSDLFA